MATRLSDNALTVLERRYLEKDEQGNPTETPDEMFRRVACAVARAERKHGASQAAGTPPSWPVARISVDNRRAPRPVSRAPWESFRAKAASWRTKSRDLSFVLRPSQHVRPALHSATERDEEPSREAEIPRLGFASLGMTAGAAQPRSTRVVVWPQSGVVGGGQR